MARRNRRGRYTVRAGDTVTTIAKQFGIDPQTLLQANTGVSNLRPGMVLKAPSGAATGGKALYSLRPEIAGGGAPPPPLYPTATQPIPAYRQPATAAGSAPIDYSQAYFGQQPAQLPDWQSAVRGTNYRTTTVAYQQSKGYSDVQMRSVGFVKYGNMWIGGAAAAPVEGGVDLTPPPVSGSSRPQSIGYVQPTKGQRNRFRSPVTMDKEYYGRTGGEGEVTYEDWYSAADGSGRYGTKYGVKSGKGKKWSNSSMRTYDEWLAKQEATTTAGQEVASEFENWVNEITGWYSEDIWTEAKTTYPPAEEPDLPPGQEPAIYDYTVWAKAAFDRYNELEKSDTKRGFYDWYQENQHIFGSAAWDKVMGKTVDGSYDTDKAKTAYAAYLGYEPTWEEEEPEFGGAAHAPRYPPGYGSGYGAQGGYMPTVNRFARPNYLGSINWRI